MHAHNLISWRIGAIHAFADPHENLEVSALSSLGRRELQPRPLEIFRESTLIFPLSTSC